MRRTQLAGEYQLETRMHNADRLGLLMVLQEAQAGEDDNDRAALVQ